jgi:hypothetical protein
MSCRALTKARLLAWNVDRWAFGQQAWANRGSGRNKELAESLE